MKKARIIVMLLILMFVFASCSTLSPYDRAFYDDPEMSIGGGEMGGPENNFQSYREGARGGGGSRGGGGCGCY